RRRRLLPHRRLPGPGRRRRRRPLRRSRGRWLPDPAAADRLRRRCLPAGARAAGGIGPGDAAAERRRQPAAADPEGEETQEEEGEEEASGQAAGEEEGDATVTARAPRRGRWAIPLLLAATALLALAAAPSARAEFGFLPGDAGFGFAATELDGSVDDQGGTHPYALTTRVAFALGSEPGGEPGEYFTDGDLR